MPATKLNVFANSDDANGAEDLVLVGELQLCVRFQMEYLGCNPDRCSSLKLHRAVSREYR